MAVVHPPAWSVILVEWVFPTLGVALLFLVLRPAGMPDLLRTLWQRHRWKWFLASRVGYTVLLLVILRWDFPADMWAWDARTEDMARGLVPGRDFFNLYGPAYPYLLAIGRWCTPGNHPIGTLWIFVAGDALAIAFGARIAQALLGGDWGERIGTWLLLDPLLWHQLAVRAQDEALFLGALALAAWLVLREMEAAAAGVLALGLCATKLTFAPYAGALLLAMAGRGRSPIGPWALFSVVVAAVYSLYLATGAPLNSEEGLSHSARSVGVGISATDLAARLIPSLPRTMLLAAYALFTVAAVVVVAWRARNMALMHRVVLALATAHAASLLSMPFCVSPYLAQGTLFVLLVVAAEPDSRLRRIGLALAVAATWFAVMYWTRSRAFSLPMKPLCIALHATVLAMAWRASSTGRDPQPVTAMPGSAP